MIELSGRYVGGVSSKGITCGAWVLSVKLRVSLVVFWFGVLVDVECLRMGEGYDVQVCVRMVVLVWVADLVGDESLSVVGCRVKGA